MKTRSEEVQLSKRARLEALLFNGAKLGTTVLSASGISEPKYPRDAGE